MSQIKELKIDFSDLKSSSDKKAEDVRLKTIRKSIEDKGLRAEDFLSQHSG
jgi:hypothetical protein